MSATTRIDRLAVANPPAVALARLCSLAVRVEPPLLRALRLLVPDADASAEADLWFSDLLSGADPTAMTLDPLVADALRPQLREVARHDLLEAAAARIAAEHANAHWSVRLEERIHYLDAAEPSGADDEIDDLLVAAVDALRTEPDPRGIARWLFGAAGRLPRAVASRVACRASTAAAALHLDQQALTELLDPAESHAWLAWIAQTLPTVDVSVSLVDGAVLIGPDGPDAHQVSVPQTDPLVLELRWTDGRRAVGTRARFRLDEPVHVETGTRSATLVTLAGASYDLVAAAGVPAGINFDQFKACLRPCLAREDKIAALVEPAEGSSWYEVIGEVGSGKSAVLVAVADEAVARDGAVVEHYFNLNPMSPLDDPATVRQSLLAQLVQCYPTELDDSADLTAALTQLAERGAFRNRWLSVVLDGLGPGQFASLGLPTPAPGGVRYLVTTQPDIDLGIGATTRAIVQLDIESNRRVCQAMIDRDLGIQAWGDIERMGPLADWLPGRLKRIIAWIARQPGTVSPQRIPAVLTTEWDKVRARYRSAFGQATEILFDMLSVGHGRHTRQDCREAAESSPDLNAEIWSRFWSSCVSDNLVAVRDDDMIELAAPEAADVLALQDFVRPGHRLLGSRHEEPPEFARTASPTRLAAAVWHALSDREVAEARKLCADLTVLRRRYATDLSGLLADLAATDMATLRGVIADLAQAGVSPAEFAPALYDRLASTDDLRLVPDLGEQGAPVGPLRVSRVIEAPDLRRSNYTTTFSGPVLAIAERSETPVLISRDKVTVAGQPTGQRWPVFDGASRGRFGGFAAWTSTMVYTEVDGQPIGPVVGRIDHVARVQLGAVAAAMDGSLVVIPFDTRPTAYPGSGVRVTAIAADRTRVVAGHEDGTIRLLYLPEPRTLSFAAHRGAVRGVVVSGDTMVSVGDDGCLLEWRLRDPIHPVARWQDGSAITCLDGPVDNRIVFGTADGRVCTRDLTTGEVHVIGTHDGPVRGVDLRSDVLVVSWSDSVLFTNPTSPGEVVDLARGFPGGVLDVLVGDQTCTVLCGDGTVTWRAMPVLDKDSRTGHGVLAVSDGTVYTGHNNAVLLLSADGTRRPVDGTEGVTQITNAGTEVGVFFVLPAGLGIHTERSYSKIERSSRRADLIAANSWGRVAYLDQRSVTVQDVARRSGDNLVAEIALGASVTSMAVSANGSVAVGLANGNTELLQLPARDEPISDTEFGVAPTLVGDGSPVAAVAAMADGSVFTGTSTGVLRHWPADATHGPVALPRRAGAITAMAVAEQWLLIGGEDGRVTLWSTRPVRLVREIDLGAPVRSVAAEPGLAAARDAYGRLWIFSLDPYPSNNDLPQLLVLASIDESGQVVDLIGQPEAGYEVTAIRASSGGVRMPVLVVGWWPEIHSNGELVVPIRPLPDHPIRLVREPPDDAWPQPAGGRRGFDIKVDVVSRRQPGYRTTRGTSLHQRRVN
jgi:hypothetical protein